MIEERIEKLFSVPADTPVIIRNSNGSVHVRGGTDKQGTATVIRRVEPDLPHTKYIEIEIDQGPPVVIRSCYSLSRVKASVDLEVVMPAGIRSLEVETLNGNILVSDIPCRLKAVTGNGFIRWNGSGGPLELHARNGMIDVSGKATVSILDTLNGDIRVELSGVTGDPATISTVSGSISIGINDGFSSEFEIVAGHGSVRTSGVDIVSPSTGAGSMRGTIGKGGARFRASARIGNVVLMKTASLKDPQN
jgi:hypothetical protein